MKTIVFLGPPGSGKGTQAKMVQDKFKLECIGSGNLLRKRVQTKDYTGRKIAQVMNQGSRVPTPIVFQIWMERLEKIKKKKIKGIVFDGSPRTVHEAQMLDQALAWYGWDKEVKVFFVKISKKEVVKRIKKRKTCPFCGPVISENEKNCLKCGRQLMERKDDSLAGINVRWQWYNKEVLPTVRYYQKKKNFFTINGEQAIDKVFQDIIKKI
jgi:adenylate kinase